jgi:hypothetical protein
MSSTKNFSIRAPGDSCPPRASGTGKSGNEIPKKEMGEKRYFVVSIFLFGRYRRLIVFLFSPPFFLFFFFLIL